MHQGGAVVREGAAWACIIYRRQQTHLPLLICNCPPVPRAATSLLGLLVQRPARACKRSQALDKPTCSSDLCYMQVGAG